MMLQMTKLMAMVMTMFLCTSMPMRDAAFLLEATQRMALPVLVFFINRVKSVRMSSATMIIAT